MEHGALDRRGFIERASKYAVGGMTAAMLLDALNPRFAEAQQVPKDDARLSAQYLEYPSPAGSGTMRGYLVRPAKATGKLPGVLVIHENRGLNPHIEDVARRIGLEGFMAFAPDALFPLGGYPGDEDKAREVFPSMLATRLPDLSGAVTASTTTPPRATTRTPRPWPGSARSSSSRTT